MIWNILTWSRLDNFGCWVRAQLEKSATSLASALMATNLNWSGGLFVHELCWCAMSSNHFCPSTGCLERGSGTRSGKWSPWAMLLDTSAMMSLPSTRCFQLNWYIVVKDHSKVDAEDLPSNMEGMEREELQCVAASYGVDFDDKADVKVLGHITHITLLKDDWG